MKKFLIILVSLIVGGMLLSSCSTPLAERFSKFVTYTETNSKNFTEKDWDKANLYFKSMLAEYARTYSTLSEADKVSINRSIASYHLLAKGSGINSVIRNAETSITNFVTNVSGVVQNVTALMNELGIRP